MIIIFSVVLSLLLVYLFFRLTANRTNVPEGLKELPVEKGFPILGIIPQIEPPMANYFAKLGKKHGSLFKIKIGMRDIVVLNDFDTIKKALKENGDAYSGRIKTELFLTATRDSGIILTDGYKWAKQRSFLLTVLRDFGLGKARSQEIVQNECLYLLDELKSKEGKRVDFAELIPVYTANIISKFIMNKRFSREDPNLQMIEKLMTDSAKTTDFVALFQVMFPVLDKAKLLSKLILIITFRWSKFEKAHDFFRREIEDHKRQLDLNSEGEDLMDRFLIKENEMKEKTGSIDTFTEWQLIRNSFELFIAGYETTSTTLGWSLLFMARFPEIQEKVYREIVDKIGNERMPTMNDRKTLNYSQAVMDEIMRLGTVVPLSLNHRTLKDTSINGFFVPSNSIIFPNLYGCHTDPNVWENPMDFKPERFLTVDSNGEVKYCPREELIPFSMGKRQCLGESLARMEYFIFFIAILQMFKVTFSEEVDEKKYEEVLRGYNGFIRFSIVKNFIFSKRN